MVKNTVIVPVGAKGGFVAKQLPDPGVDRDAWLAEGIASYKTFISALLDITDNMVAGEVVHPADVVRHDEDDTYLVVAADKGTAKFSDIANEVAESYNFWLGDAFASGGSAGYDHKGMGITARGAWESVKRHFRELGVDTQTQDFTVVGIGDMSGDVFGNGMLLSEHIRLVAAFDHRHIFIDPTPDAATSYAERRRLFELPRSSWEDYNTELLSAGGGIFPRTAKSIPVNAHVREALGIEPGVTKMTPAELMKAILSSPVDLLWNGGIGTYVKASTESNADVGDKGNDAIRVDGKDLRVQVVGEGGNLGLTQLGRIEFALQGGRINTDAIDNSAGVDTSDHEVNIKILLNGLVKDGDMTVKQRNKLLAQMTDEVGALVLRNNYAQNTAIANALAQSRDMLHAQQRFMRHLVREGHLNRALEFLPTDRQIRERLSSGHGLTGPETAVLLAYTKITVAEELLHLAAGRPVPQGSAAPTSRRRCASSSPSRSTATRCAARSRRPSWSTTRSTRAVRRICTGCARRPARRSRRSCGRRPWRGRSSAPRRCGTRWRSWTPRPTPPSRPGSGCTRAAWSSAARAGCSTTGRSRWSWPRRWTSSPSGSSRCGRSCRSCCAVRTRSGTSTSTTS